MSTQYAPLNNALNITDKTRFKTALVRRLLDEIDLRLKAVFEVTNNLSEAEALLRQAAIDKINETLIPAMQLVLTIQDRGFLIAHSATEAEIDLGNVLTFAIEDEAERMVFTPSPFVFLSRSANTTDWAIARRIGYSKVSGELLCEVVENSGDTGPHTDWEISAIAGSTIAQMAMLEEAYTVLADAVTAKDDTLQAKADTYAARDVAVAARNQAEDFAEAADDIADEVEIMKGQTEAARNTAGTHATNAGISAAAAAASALSIAGGPVTSVNSKTGIVYLDPTDVTAVRPTLDLDFRHSKGAPFSGNFTRATVGGYRRRSIALLSSTAINEPLIDHAGDSTPLGTGFFGAYTNASVWSEDLSNAAWTKDNVTISTNAIAAPDGTMTMDKIVENSASAVFHRIVQIMAGNTNQACTQSWFVVAAERTKVKAFLFDNAATTNYVAAVFDLVAETAVTSTGGNGSTPTAEIKKIAGSFYRISLSGIPNTGGGAGNIQHQMRMLNAAGNEAYTGDGVSGLYAWGSSFTQTAFPVPYVPTAGSTVTRNADVFGISGANFAEFWNPLENTVYIEGDILGEPSNVQYLVHFSDGTTNNVIAIRQGAIIIGADLYIVTGGVAQVDTNSVNIRQGNSFRLAANFAANSAAIYSGGAVVGGIDPSLTMPIVTSMSINPVGGIRLRRLILWPKALTATELQRMTA